MDLALFAIGRDRPGVVAAVTGVLLEHGVNVGDTQMGILGGHFSMMLILEAGDHEEEQLRTDLEEVARRLELEALALRPVDHLSGHQNEPSHIVTVYGADHPGIVHATAMALADRDWGITDLNTRLVGEGEQSLYALMMEVAVPPGEAGDLEGAMEAVAGEEGVEVTVRELEDDEL